MLKLFCDYVLHDASLFYAIPLIIYFISNIVNNYIVCILIMFIY